MKNLNDEGRAYDYLFCGFGKATAAELTLMQGGSSMTVESNCWL